MKSYNYFTGIVYFRIIYVKFFTIEEDKMRLLDAEKILRKWDREGRYVFTRSDLAKILDESSPNTLSATLQRLVKAGILVRAAHNTYIFGESTRPGSTVLEEIALSLRRGEYVYESYESALSQWGIISQIPIDRLTLATTGRSGTYKTPYGVIEFTHTSSNPKTIVENTVERPGHPVPIANQEFALKNLKRAKRNIEMIDEGLTK